MATVFTQAGEEWLADKVDESIQTKPEYVGWGTGAGTSAKGDIILFSEASEARVQGSMSQPAADKTRVVATLTCAGAGKTITNAGSFTNSTGATLVVKGDFTGVPLSVGDKIEFTIDIEWT